MDLFNEWQKIEKNQFSQSINKEDIMKAIYQDSKSTISLLKKRLLYKIYYVIGFIALFMVSSFYFRDNNAIVLLTAIWIVLYLIGGTLLFRKYKEMTASSIQGSMLDNLKKNAYLIKSALRTEEIWGSLIFPIALVTGVSIGKLAKGASFVDIFTDTKTLLIMGVSIVLFLPLFKYVTNKMNDHAYGKEIASLEDKISKMETLDNE